MSDLNGIAENSIISDKLDIAELQAAGLMLTGACVFQGGATGTNAPQWGYNVTSVTRNAAGDYTINLTESLDFNNYLALVTASEPMARVVGRSTSTTRVEVLNTAFNGSDAGYIGVYIFGGKA